MDAAIISQAIAEAEVLSALKFPKGTRLKGNMGGTLVTMPGKPPFLIIVNPDSDPKGKVRG